MQKHVPSRHSLMPMALAAGLIALPMLAHAQRDGTPGNPPGTAVGRAVDRATGSPTVPDGTPGNPAGTALDRGTGTAVPGARPPMMAQPATPGVAQTTMQPAPSAGMMGASPAALATPGSALMMRPRLSQIIGGNVYNERNERIGEVDDILLTHSSTTASNAPAGPIAVLQIGGFLGMGGRLVAVPLGDLRWNTERSQMVMPGATKEALQTRTAFDYDTVRSR